MNHRWLAPLLLALVHGHGAAATIPALTAGAAPADLVFVNGAVYTVDAARSRATALAVRKGIILFVGGDRGARAFVGPRTQVIDLQQRTLLPGFQDSHSHPSLVINPANKLDLKGSADREAISEQVRRFALEHPQKSWVTGSGWDEAAFLPSGHPTREMLDALVPDRPAFLVNNSQHQAWANSRALAAAHITGSTPNPANGLIERDAAGNPTGSLQEAAMDLVRAVIPAPTPQERVEDLEHALRTMSALGITAILDAAARPDDKPAYATLEKNGRLPVRATLCQYFDPAADDEQSIRDFKLWKARLHSDRLKADCVKVVLDGSYGSHTVALFEPYLDEPAFGLGKLFVEPARLRTLVTRLEADGFQMHVHAIGDRAVRTALDAIEAARRVNGPRDGRHTLAHLSLIAPADLPRFRQLGVVANMTPLWSRGDPWETVFAPRMFGAERAARLYQTRSLLDSGAMLVWGSDWPVTGVSPLEGLETAVTHRYPGGKDPSGADDHEWIPAERVNLEQAITAYTAAGAYLSHENAWRGSLQVGKAADLVVLDRDLFAAPALAIHEVQVDMTVLGGKVVYERLAR
jgi:predicted amidohydrolase YtcJ